MVLNTDTTVYGVVANLDIKKRIASNVQKSYGLSYPLTKNVNSGYFSKESGKELVRDNLKQLLSTHLGERVMLPGFGLNLNKYLFQPMDNLLFESIKNEIIGAVAKYAKNVKILKIGVYPLDDYGAEGLQAMQIKLSVQVKEIEDTTFEVGVKIG